MPSIFSKKSNRSHQSVDATNSGQSSPNPSALAVNNDGTQRYQAQDGQQLPQGVPQGQYQQQQQQPQHPYPARNPSTHRLSSHLDQVSQSYQQQPQLSPGVESRHSSYQPQSPPPPVHEPKKSLRSRIADRVTGHGKEEEPSRQASKNGVGRHKSVRKSDPRLAEQQLQESQRLQTGQQWQHGSNSHLPTSAEQDEDNLDPFLQQEDQSQPQVPPKDYPQRHQQQHPPQYVGNPQQQYNRPPLDRVSTEGSYRTQGGVSQLSQYSPDHHQGQGLQSQQQPAQQQQQYQSYQPNIQPPQNQTDYQAFNPQSAPSPLLANAQLHGQTQNTTPQQQQQQQIYYQQQQQEQSPQHAKGHSPLDLPQQSVHYQQQQFAPQPHPQPHPGQDFQQHQTGRTSSQQPPELQHPQAIRQPLQLAQSQQIDSQQLQQLRPPSSQQLAPPSPLQPQPYKTYEPQAGQQPPQQQLQSQQIDNPPANPSPPQQGQENMPSGAQNSGRSTLRKVAEGPPPGASSRETSLLQQPSGQGQPHGHPPVSPGLATFDANVVPTGSQGQPYRGEKGQQAQQTQSGEMGRATPPPRSAVTDMSDEEIEKMMKEHEVLREKYQKVKRYFFEQQTQVHQLQNTLANQRMSLSRTSWDDSEYATRFNRLDGLIAQLSFSIRKDWKAIPQFLHTVVNKTAVETGKQEMTAVGRAFISYWLVENIFEKYFHPDLEPGFSTQLQSIVMNIRKFSPACHSPEDEDSLAAKIINWRLATLEGLADTLRAPQAAKYRQELIETLNEKLIASLQMHMNDPAPADLNGGVPMIIELAVSVAQHLPLESREVHIEYFSPGHGIVAELMKLETGIPALTAPILDVEEADRASVRSAASKDVDSASIAEQEQLAAQQMAQMPKEEKKRSVFGFGGGSKKPTTTPASLGKRESTLGSGGSQQSLTQNPPGSSNGPKEDAPAPRVRMSVGFAVQIRGKSVLMKAPVYSL